MRTNSRQAPCEPDEESWRVFCAVTLPDTARARLKEHIDCLRQAFPDAHASWNRPENIHLTLKFLGETHVSRLENLSRAADRAVEGSSPFQLTLEETGAFPSRGAPRVLWIGVRDESTKLAKLHARLEEACTAEGFAEDQRPFRPHLTLARLRRPQFARALASAHNELRFESTELIVTELLVIRSELSAEGSRYTIISRHDLVMPTK